MLYGKKWSNIFHQPFNATNMLAFKYWHLAILTIFIGCHQPKEMNSQVGTIVHELDKNIWEIFQDSQSNYWFGSNGNGVFLYDGQHIRQFTTKDGLIDDQIRRIQEDKYGAIYIETSGGISKFDGTKFETLEASIVQKNEWRLHPDDLWFNCNGGPLFRYDGRILHKMSLPKMDLVSHGMDTTGLSSDQDFRSPYAVYGISKDKDGNLWIGTMTAGAYRFDGKSFLWFGEKELSTLADGRVPCVRSMLQDDDGAMWLSNTKTRYIVTSDSSYTKTAGIAPPEQLPFPYYISGVMNDGTMWLSTYSNLYSYDGHTTIKHEIGHGATQTHIMKVMVDRIDQKWIGTDSLGVFRWDGDQFSPFLPQ